MSGARPLGRVLAEVGRSLALAATLAGCASVPAPRVSPPPAERASAAWARVLREFVNDAGQVDFRALADSREDLDRFIAYVARVDPDADSEVYPTPEHRMAYHINAYNALSMYGVLELGIPATNAGLRKVRFFYLRRYQIAGRRESLYTYEKRIRELGDERVHFALNCMSVSCPRLPRQPFRAATLEADLGAATREFFASSAHLRVDHAERRIRVSSILKFYRDEFLREADGLVEYVNRFVSEPIPPDYAVEFLPYDWTINKQPAPDEAALAGHRGSGSASVVRLGDPSDAR